MANHFLGEEGQKIHIIESPPIPGAPILHIPGMFGIAEDCIAEMMALAHRKSFAMSLRGRGSSDSAASYTIEDHVADVVLALEYIQQPVTICSHSVSNLFAVGAAYVRPDLVSGLCLIDYGLQTRLSEKWLTHCLQNCPSTVSPPTINQIFSDLKGDVWYQLSQLEIPVVYFQGLKAGSQSMPKDIEQFKALCSDFELVKLPNSHHWPNSATDYNLFIEKLDRVSSTHEQQRE